MVRYSMPPKRKKKFTFRKGKTKNTNQTYKHKRTDKDVHEYHPSTPISQSTTIQDPGIPQLPTEEEQQATRARKVHEEKEDKRFRRSVRNNQLNNAFEAEAVSKSPETPDSGGFTPPPLCSDSVLEAEIKAEEKRYKKLLRMMEAEALKERTERIEAQKEAERIATNERFFGGIKKKSAIIIAYEKEYDRLVAAPLLIVDSWEQAEKLGVKDKCSALFCRFCNNYWSKQIERMDCKIEKVSEMPSVRKWVNPPIPE